MVGESADTHFSACALSGSVVIVVDPPDTCPSPRHWAESYFFGTYLRESTPVAEVASAVVVRVHSDLRNLCETLRWLAAHDAEAGLMADRCRAIACSVYDESNLTWYVASVLNEM
jgi:hypothetical protein